jgi:hypothetical protein
MFLPATIWSMRWLDIRRENPRGVIALYFSHVVSYRPDPLHFIALDDVPPLVFLVICLAVWYRRGSSN